MRSQARQIRLALTHRDFRLLWLGQLFGDLGDAVARIALAILIYDETSSSFLTASVIAVSMVPYLGPGQYLTAWAERFPRRTVLVSADVVRALCFAAIALPVPIGVRFVLLLMSALADPPFAAVRRALVPTTLPDDLYGSAVTITTVTTEASFLGGAAAGGVLASVIGPSGVLLINAGSFTLSAGLLLAMQAGVQAIAPAGAPRERVAIGYRAVRSDGRVFRLFWLFPAASVGVLGTEALVTPFVREELGRSETVIGALGAVISIGVLIATAGLRTHSRHDALVRQTSRVAMLGSSIAVLGFALPSALPSAVLAYLGVGVVYAFRIPVTIVFGQRLEDEVRASALSVLDGLYSLAELGAALGAGVLAEVVGPRTACIALAASSVGVACVSALRPVSARRDPLLTDGGDVEAEARATE